MCFKIKPKFVGGLEVTWPKFSSVDDGMKLAWRLTFLCVSYVVIETPISLRRNNYCTLSSLQI